MRRIIGHQELAYGAATRNDIVQGQDKKNGGFHETPLITKDRVRQNIQMKRGGMVPKGVMTNNFCIAVYANIVPDAAMSHSILLGNVVG